MPRYTYDSAAEWLAGKINDAETLIDAQDLARSLATAMDEDQIQDLFQQEMSEDGFFEDLDAPAAAEEGDDPDE